MENLLSWFALKSVPGIGNHLFKRLIDRFSSPEHVFDAADKELLEVDGISPRLADAIHQHKIPDLVQQDIELALKKGYKIVTMTAPDYPSLLLQIPDPPPFLYVYGNPAPYTRSIAVVGSRRATQYGLSAAVRLCRELTSLDITIVSGMARGIDTAAHHGTLKKNGKTVAILGSGLERVYPSENLGLFHKIAETGAVMSEFHLHAGPDPHHFPVRNRIISGMTLGTLVVEAGKRSGALITARLAAEQGREVFAVPGNIHSFSSIGPHELIKQGAKLVTTAQDIVDELSQALRSHMSHESINQEELLKQLPPLTEEELLVFKSLGPYPIHIDDLVRKLSIDPGKLSSILLQLELKGVVHQEPGKLFALEVGN